MCAKKGVQNRLPVANELHNMISLMKDFDKQKYYKLS